MRHKWPSDTEFTRKELVSDERTCSCGRRRKICDHRRHPVYTLDGPVEIICKLLHCPDKACPEHSHTISPIDELSIAPKGWLIGWDVFAFIGHRRMAQHWSVPNIRHELKDSYNIRLSDDAIERYIDRYQTMLAARHQDPALLKEEYQDINDLVLTIDGLQPEKGHETLYVVRELNAKRVWFAVPLLSSSEAEVRRIIAQAREWAEALGKPVRLWMSDKQDAFVKGIAAEFKDVPHRYCDNHFVRGLAKPILEADSQAKVKMRKKVRGLRAIEREVLDGRREAELLASQTVAAEEPGVVEAGDGVEQLTQVSVAGLAVASPSEATVAEAEKAEPAVDEAGEVVLAYCACVRGILNDDQGGPQHPAGLRMTEALQEVRESLGRNLELEEKKGEEAYGQLEKLAKCIDRGIEAVASEQEEIRSQVEDVKRVAATLECNSGTSSDERKKEFEEIAKELQTSEDSVRRGMATMMVAWMVGLFIGGDDPDLPVDNLDLERWFRLPKGHERHIHGRSHAGIRIVQEGATLLPALDAHVAHDGPFSAADLQPYQLAQKPLAQIECLKRRKIMRKARSPKNRPLLLAQL